MNPQKTTRPRQPIHRKIWRHWPYALLLVPVLVEWIDDRRLPISLGGTITDVVMVLIIVVTVAIIQRQKRRLHASTITDPLTGLFNARHLQTELDRQVALANRTSSPLVLLFMDLDHLKSVNDRFGHVMGNDILRQFAQHLISVTKRDVDICFRFGGDEFAVLCQLTDLSSGLLAAHRVWEAGSQNKTLKEMGITLSIGVAQLKGEESAADFLRRADNAMYKAKESGRNRIQAAE